MDIPNTCEEAMRQHDRVVQTRENAKNDILAVVRFAKGSTDEPPNFLSFDDAVKMRSGEQKSWSRWLNRIETPYLKKYARLHILGLFPELEGKI